MFTNCEIAINNKHILVSILLYSTNFCNGISKHITKLIINQEYWIRTSCKQWWSQAFKPQSRKRDISNLSFFWIARASSTLPHQICILIIIREEKKISICVKPEQVTLRTVLLTSSYSVMLLILILVPDSPARLQTAYEICESC